MTVTLLDLPDAALHRIVDNLGMEDRIRLAKVSRKMRAIERENKSRCWNSSLCILRPTEPDIVVAVARLFRTESSLTPHDSAVAATVTFTTRCSTAMSDKAITQQFFNLAYGYKSVREATESEDMLSSTSLPPTVSEKAVLLFEKVGSILAIQALNKLPRAEYINAIFEDRHIKDRYDLL